MTLSAREQTSIRQSVLSARNVPRVDVNRVDFSIRTGTIVPRRVHVVSVATFPVLVEVFPRFRDYDFFVVEDEIVFVDDSHRIVEVVPVGPQARFSSRTASELQLSHTEIREVQRVLIDEGFLTGEVDGIFGPRTREALIGFQRARGLEVTGSINTRTVTALGLSNRINATASQSRSTTTGQGQSQSTTGQGQDNTSEGNGAAQRSGTTGQVRTGGTQPPSAQRSPDVRSRSQSTTGQGGNANDVQPGQDKPSSTGQGGGANQSGQNSQPSTTGRGGMVNQPRQQPGSPLVQPQNSTPPAQSQQNQDRTSR